MVPESLTRNPHWSEKWRDTCGRFLSYVSFPWSPKFCYIKKLCIYTLSVKTFFLKDKFFVLVRHILIPQLMVMLVRKIVFYHQRRIYHILPPQGLHM